MLFLVILVIALGWAGFFWSWGRDRFVSNSGIGLPPSPFAPRPPSPLAPPRTPAMARRRRREVLGVLGLLALLTFLVARAWSPMWTLHVLIDLALVGYAWAVYTIERGPVPVRESGLSSWPNPSRGLLQPVLDEDAAPVRPGPAAARRHDPSREGQAPFRAAR